MKMLKRTISMMLTVAMLCACFSIPVFAASAELRFSDPDTTVGAEVKVTATFTSDSGVQSMEATLSFDTEMLRFVEGGNAQVSGGTITLTGAGDGMSTKITHELTFQALAEGTTKIEVVDSEGVSTSGSDIDVTNGSSTITIGPGDPSLIKTETTGGVKIDVNGTTYTVSGDFSEALVPQGFVMSETQFEGTTCKVVTQESSGTIAMYLVADGAEEGDFFLYDSLNGQFSPFEEVEIADNRYLIFLQNDGTLDIPAGYSETTIMIEGSGKEFSAWQNTENSEYYLVYGLNSDGTKALYLYDTVDGTYQRFLKGSTTPAIEEEAVAEGALGEILTFVGDNLMLCLVVFVAAILFLLLILIVVAIKLRHRNLELDDLYDEYGIDLDDEEEEEPVKAKKEKKGLFKKKAKDEEDFDDFDDYDDEYDDEDDYEDDDFDAYDDEDDDIDDLDEVLNTRVRKPVPRQTSKAATKSTARQASKPAAKSAPRQASKPAVKPAAPRPVAPTVEKPAPMRGHMELDDTFKMDIIDLD